jgi:hypothetical protein
MPDNTLSLLNVFDLPPEQREILLHLTRKGPTAPAALAALLSMDADAVDQALQALMNVNKVRINSQGEAEIVLGQTRRRALPTQLLPVLLATDRLYTAQEIAALRLAVPMLQFARAKMGEFADHGPGHALRVKTFATQLSYLHRCSPLERHLLRAAALFHDVGNAADRVNHHLVSADTVEKLTARGDLPFSEDEAHLIAQLCRWHRGDYDPAQIDHLRGETIRTGLLASLLRIADRLDIDQRRYDYTEQFSRVVEFFYPQEVPFWNSLRDVLLVRIKESSESIALQIYTRPGVEDNFQIAALRQAIRATPFNWAVEVLPVSPEEPARRALTGEEPLAVIACPFDPHSLIMTAISRRHLQQAGYLVRVICYADTPGGSAWLWKEQLPKLPPASHGMLVVIGDRPNAATADSIARILQEWQRAGVPVHLLNRHEANWGRLPDTFALGAQAVMGSDGCYFWGDHATQADMDWSRIAALVTRDPTQTLAGMTIEEEQIAQGFLRVVHEAAVSLPDDQMNWSGQADPILKRISGNEFAYFRGQAEGFNRLFAGLTPTRREGRVLVFAIDGAAHAPQIYFWALEHAIEQQGRLRERGMRFRTPYAIAHWNSDDGVEIIAINHWREEDAIPIRFLYPTELQDLPEGHEGAIRLHVSAERAPAVITALVNACNNDLLQR